MDYKKPDQRFAADLHQALRRYRTDELGESDLARSLCLVQARLRRKTMPDTPFHRATALREILTECLEALKEQGQAKESWILKERFVADRTVVSVAQELSVSEATLHNRQAKAQTALAAILWQKERKESEGLYARARSALCKLPAPTYTRLFGVTERLSKLTHSLNDAGGRWLIALDGLGGIGKTALAREAVEQAVMNDRFADLVWETAQRERFVWGSRQKIAGPALTFERLLDAIASQLGQPEIRRQSLDNKKADIKYLLGEAPYLIVVDNLETAVDFEVIVDGLWSLTNPSKVLVTSRYRLSRYEQAHTIHLHPLGDADAVAFMRYHGAERGVAEVVEATEEALLSLQRVAQGNPLAIKLVIGQIDRRPLARVLVDLQAARGEAAELYTFIYHRSWDMLSDAGRVLLLNMPHLPPAGGDEDDLLAASGLTEPELATAIDELVNLSLLNLSGPEERRYSIHQLTHHFVLSELVQR